MADPTPDLLAELRRVPLVADLTDDDLAWIAERGEVRRVAQGDVLFHQGAPAEWMIFGLEGTLETRRRDAPAGAPSYTFAAGDLYGVIPFSRMQALQASGVVVSPQLRVLLFPRAQFDTLIQRVPALEARFVAFLADRVRNATRREQQFEKMNALGRLSAGLAHELNNPAAAARRSASEARRRLHEAGGHAAALAQALAGAGGDACAAALAAPDALRARAAERATAQHGAPDDPLERSDREQAVGDWLEAAGTEDAWTIAPTFAEAGLGADDLEAVLGPLPAAARAPAAAWGEAALAADAALVTVERAAGRISELVGAVKHYTHMDRGLAAGSVDVREGVETTLTLLAHKLRDRGVALERQFAAPLPPVRGFAGELNQVWTNLLDNAIDAAADAHPADGSAASASNGAGGPDGAGRQTGGGSGRVRVRAFADRGDVVVEVEDDGAGVPDELRERVWEPFFTTKPVGRGTGLGLDIARHVVVEQHGGQLTLDTRPGRTVFAVRLPAEAAPNGRA